MENKITELHAAGFNFMKNSAKVDFLDELRLDFQPEKAYFDPVDGLPVAVLKVKTNEVAKDHNGYIHPGALCVMFDHLSTYCVFADPNWWHFPDGTFASFEISPHIINRIGLEIGLSRNIKMHLQAPIEAGSTVRFVTKVLENTPKSTYFFSQIFAMDGRLMASGHHDKVKLTKVVKPKI